MRAHLGARGLKGGQNGQRQAKSNTFLHFLKQHFASRCHKCKEMLMQSSLKKCMLTTQNLSMKKPFKHENNLSRREKINSAEPTNPSATPKLAGRRRLLLSHVQRLLQKIQYQMPLFGWLVSIYSWGIQRAIKRLSIVEGEKWKPFCLFLIWWRSKITESQHN